VNGKWNASYKEEEEKKNGMRDRERDKEKERENGRLFFLLVFKCDVLCRRQPRWMDGSAKQLQPLGG
jgi:hypothetical protein